MSAVMERERRATAGKRMTFLAGQELENDEAFWTHDTWQEDNESFHSSDAASSAEEDVFDSDFDESENEDDVIANEEMVGAAMEREIEQEERDHNNYNKKRGSAYTEVSNKLGPKKKAMGSGGRRPGTGPNGKRIVGDGLNAGIVLNVPPQYQKNNLSRLSKPLHTPAVVPIVPQQQPLLCTTTPSSESIQIEATRSTHIPDPKLHVALDINSTTPTTATIATDTTLNASAQTSLLPRPDTTVSFQLHSSSPTNKKKRESGPTLAATRIRRSSHENKITPLENIRSRKSIKTIDKLNNEKSPPATNGLKRGKQAFTQEELLLEAVQATEPENERWILGQKRNQAIRDDIETQLRNSQSSDKNTKVIEKYVSRRGYFNTITFPDMDHIPNILQRRRSLSTSSSEQQSKQTKPLCIITGKVAKFRDPKTGHGYFDIEAFRELRRRYEAKELPACEPKDRTEVAKVNAVRLDAPTPMDMTTMTNIPEGRTKVKPHRRSKATSNETGIKRKAATNGRKRNGKEMKGSNLSNENGHAGTLGTNDNTLVEQIDDKVSPQSKRLRATSTGGESVHSTMTLHSEVYDYEIISPSNHVSDYPKNVNNHNGNTGSANSNIAKLPLSPPLSPGRKSPRTPKPTVKVLESARAMIPSLLLPQPLLQSQHPILNPLDDDATTSTPFPTSQQPTESVKN